MDDYDSLDTYEILAVRRDDPDSDILHNLTDRQIELMTRDGFGPLLETVWARAESQRKWREKLRLQDLMRRRRRGSSGCERLDR